MKKEIIIHGMSCGHCATHVEEALKEIDGVDNVSVDLLERKATVAINKEIDINTFREAIEEAGYEFIEVK